MASEAFSPDELPVVIEADGAKISAKETGEMTFLFYRFAKGSSLRHSLHGLPGDACTCPHWGYVLSGRLRIHTGEGAIEVGAGQAFHVEPGHFPEALEDTTMVEVSPTKEIRAVGEHIMRQLAAPA
jgi:hypothetical protein